MRLFSRPTVTASLLHAVLVESNHYHLKVTDKLGKLPEFVRDS
jgi:hypothetical protein